MAEVSFSAAPEFELFFPFLKKRGAVCIFVSNNWIRVEGKSLCGMTFLWNQTSVFWTISRTLSGLKSLIMRKRSSHWLQSERWEEGSGEWGGNSTSQRGGLIHPWLLTTPDAVSLGWGQGAFPILLLYKHVCAISIWFCSTFSKKEMTVLVECDQLFFFFSENTGWSLCMEHGFPPSILNFKLRKSFKREERAVALEPGIVHFKSMPSTS